MNDVNAYVIWRLSWNVIIYNVFVTLPLSI